MALQNEPESSRATSPSGEISLAALGEMLLRQWRIAVLVAGAVVLLTGLFLALAPRQYTAAVVLLRSQDERRPDARTDLLTTMLRMDQGGGSNQALVDAVLASRSFLDTLVIRSSTEAERTEVARAVHRRMRVTSGPAGTISVQVRDGDAERAARIAAEIPRVVNEMVLELSAEHGRRRQDFLAAQVADAGDRLREAEAELVAFQQREGTPEIQQQASLAMTTMAGIQQQIMQAELEVARLRRTATADNPELRAALGELAALRQQLAQLTRGERSVDRLFPTLQASPELRAAALRLQSELARNEQIYSSLSVTLAQAQLEAHNSLPVVGVLDPPVVPRSPSFPSMRRTVVMGLFLATTLGLAAAVLADLGRAWRRRSA